MPFVTEFKNAFKFGPVLKKVQEKSRDSPRINNPGAKEVEPVAGGLRRAERGERARPDLPEAAAGRAGPDLAPAELEDQAARRGPQDAEDRHSVPHPGKYLSPMH